MNLRDYSQGNGSAENIFDFQSKNGDRNQKAACELMGDTEEEEQKDRRKNRFCLNQT